MVWLDRSGKTVLKLEKAQPRSEFKFRENREQGSNWPGAGKEPTLRGATGRTSACLQSTCSSPIHGDCIFRNDAEAAEDTCQN